MTEDKYSKAKNLQEDIEYLKEKLEHFEKTTTTKGCTAKDSCKDTLFYIKEESQEDASGWKLFNSVCKDEFITMINNIKTRLRAEINNLETEFHEL